MDLPEPERWNQINAVLAEAHRKPESERDAYVASACGDDATLRREVESLLDAADTYGGLFDEGAAVLAESFLFSDDEEAPESPRVRLEVGERIGPYRLIRRIGRGGTSVVFRAERVDQQFERTVAIKVLRGILGHDDETIERFRAERQILASVSHPNLAEVYDGGVLPDGRPYLVMEYVDGRPITEHCREEASPLDERLALFRQAAEAVQAAHEQLVVHRDLKPSNVLVERGTNTVKLLDFGIAKMLGDLPGSAPPATQTGRRPMTPAYAAPEQVQGDDICVATDTYALGILLYELLTDERPFGSPEHSPYAVARTVCEEDPPAPSSVVEAGPRRSTLRGDLDAITLKAIRKAPGARYATVGDLVNDLDRFRTNRPVHASRGGWTYRARKFVDRHRTVLGGAVMTLALLVGLAVYHGQRLTEERNRAREQARTAEEVAEFMVELFEASNPAGDRSGPVTARTVLQQGQEQISKLEDEPAIQAQLLDAMGRAHMGLGNYEVADSLLRRALSIRRKLYTSPHPSIAAGFDHLSRALDGRGQYAAAESLASRALRMRRGIEDSRPSKIAQSMRHLGLYKKQQGEYAAAESLYTRALALQREAVDPPHRLLSANLNNLAQVLTNQGEYAVAESLHRETLAMRKKLFGRFHPKVSESLNNLAMAVEREGRVATAESLYRETLAIDREVLGPEHPYIPADMNNLAITLEKQGQYAAAESLKREALALRREILRPKHPQITVSMNNLAVLLRKKGEYREAASLFRRVLVRNRAHYEGPHPYIAATLGNLGDTYREQGRLASADSLYQDALDMMLTVFDGAHPKIAETLEKRAALREAQRRLGDAEALQERALEMHREVLGPKHPKTAESLSGLADLHMKQGQLESAESLYRDALSIFQQAVPENDWRRAYIGSKLGACLTRQGRHAEAEVLLVASVRTLRSQRGSTDTYTRRAARDLIRLYDAWGRPEKATKYEDLVADEQAQR